MRKLTTGSVLIGLQLASLGRAAPAPKTLMFNLTTVTDAQGMHVNVEGKVWVKGKKARFETNSPMTGPTIVLVDGSRVHTLYPQQRRGTVTTLQTGKKGPKNPVEFIVANVSHLTQNAHKTGKQTLDGYDCDVYQLSQQAEGQHVTLKAWITRSTQPRLPLKVENSEEVKRPNITMRRSQVTRITGLRMGVPIPDSLFTVPPGYKIVESGPAGAPGLPGPPGMGGPGAGR